MYRGKYTKNNPARSGKRASGGRRVSVSRDSSPHAAVAERKGSPAERTRTAALIALSVIFLVSLTFLVRGLIKGRRNSATRSGAPLSESVQAPESVPSVLPFDAGKPEEEESLDPQQPGEAPVVEPEQPIEVEQVPSFEPHAVESTEPSRLIAFTEILDHGEYTERYSRDEPLAFGLPSDYAALPGILAFRGDNFRSGSSYGTVSVSEKNFEQVWWHSTGTLVAPDGNVWTGSGWTGQPLLVEWPKATRQIMNLYDWAKEADRLTEVIYATMDGNIYFFDLDSGDATRDPLDMGFTFKGSGSLDPRGYPVLYVGAGYDSAFGSPRAFAISLIDCSTLFSFGNDDSFANRSWYCFDASPLVDAETDTLIYPGESGVLYIVHLNTAYDEQEGTLTMDPSFTKWRYQGHRSSSLSYWLGIESSPVIFQSHAILADNGGHLMCLDLNTLTLDWVQDIWDDTNSSPVLELEDGHPYVYIAPSFHLGWRSDYEAEVPVFKIDAETGEIVWQQSYDCLSEPSLSGGVQGTIAVGKEKLSDLIYVPFARTRESGKGTMAALDKQTGEIVWELDTNSYTWVSPTLVYTEEGDGYLIFSTLYGSLCFVDGRTGELLNVFDLDSSVESTAAVYHNRLVIGTRSNGIFCLNLI